MRSEILDKTPKAREEYEKTTWRYKAEQIINEKIKWWNGPSEYKEEWLFPPKLKYSQTEMGFRIYTGWFRISIKIHIREVCTGIQIILHDKEYRKLAEALKTELDKAPGLERSL